MAKKKQEEIGGVPAKRAERIASVDYGVKPRFSDLPTIQTAGNIPQAGQAPVSDDSATPAPPTDNSPSGTGTPKPTPTPTPTEDTPPPGGGTTTAKDWAEIFWQSLGIPPDLVKQINDALSGVSDDATAQALGTNILRASQWYQTTFPGIAYGIRNGLFTDEQGYRDYVNKLNVFYKQYQGRAVNTNEVTGFLQQGLDSTIVGKQLQGNAIIQAESPELQYEAGAFTQGGALSSQEMTAYGQEKAGLDSSLGQLVTNRLADAQRRMQKIFEGKLQNPAISQGPQGIYSAPLQGPKNTNTTKTGSPDLPAL